MSFSARIRAGIVGRLTGSPDIGDATYAFDDSTDLALSLGTAANQAKTVFTDERTIVASGSDTLDLAGGGLRSALGTILTFTAVKAIKIAASPSNANAVVVGGGPNPFRGWFADATDKLAIPPGGVVLLGDPSADGQPVTAATGDLLLVANAGGSTAVTYTITIVGED